MNKMTNQIQGLYFDEVKRTLFIDIIPLTDNRKNSGYEMNIINELKKMESRISILHIYVSKSYSISMFEKDTKLIRCLIDFFYSSNINIEGCFIYNTPSTFSSMFGIVKPFLSKKALSIIHFERENITSKDVFNCL